jgi:YfiR/HmsC-like
MTTHSVNNQPFCRLLTILLSLSQGVVASDTAEPPSLTETQVKAVFLFKFTKFITWPDEIFANAEEPLQICVLGDDPFGEKLDLAVKDEKVKNRPVLLQRLQELSANHTCHAFPDGFTNPA